MPESSGDLHTLERRVFQYPAVDRNGHVFTTFVVPVSLEDYRKETVESLVDAKLRRDRGESHYGGDDHSWEDEIGFWEEMIKQIDAGEISIQKVDVTDTMTPKQLNEAYLEEDARQEVGFSTIFPEINRHIVDTAVLQKKLDADDNIDVIGYIGEQNGRLFHLSDAGDPRIFEASFGLVTQLLGRDLSVFERRAVEAFEQQLLYEKFWEEWDMESRFEVDFDRSNPDHAKVFAAARDKFFADTWDTHNEMYDMSEDKLLKLAPVKPDDVYFRVTPGALDEAGSDLMKHALIRIAEIKSRNWLFLEEIVKHQDAMRVNAIDVIENMRSSSGDTTPIRRKGDGHWRTIHEAVEIMTADLMGVSVSDLSEMARKRLYEYGASLHRDTFERLKAITHSGKVNNMVLAEAFLATEFGDDLGEAILNIAEKKGHEYEAQQIFSLISSVRDNLSDWESKAWFAQKDGEYQGYFIGIKRAIEMRISQILSPVPDLMDGVSQDARYFHRDETVAETAQVDSIDKVIQGLKLLSLLTEKIAATEAVPLSDRVPSVGDDFSAASTPIGQSKVRVMMRPHESNASEARVRWTVTITPEEQMEIFGKYLDLNKQGKPRNAKISLRLDLEKISKMLSLDLGTRMDFGSDMREYPDRLLAALVTAGVQHSLTKQGRDILHTDYHVRDTFSEDLSRPERFAGFAELMIENYVDQSRLKRGKLGKHATRLSVDPESLKTDVVYTGLFFDDDSVKQLLDLLPAKYAHVPRHLHATIKYRPSEGLAGFSPGEGHTVKVVGVVDDGHAQALIVESTAMGDVKHPHITISTANDENGKAIPPSYSNHAIKQAVQNGTVRWLETPIELSATSGYLDGKSREIVTSV